MKETLIDIETYSEVDIGKCGLYRYATDPSFEILLVAWATDEGDGFGETRCADLASGEPLPKELLADFLFRPLLIAKFCNLFCLFLCHAPHIVHTVFFYVDSIVDGTYHVGAA